MTRAARRPPVTSGIGSEPFDSADWHLGKQSLPFRLADPGRSEHVRRRGSSVHVVARFGTAIARHPASTESRKAKEAPERLHGQPVPELNRGHLADLGRTGRFAA